MTQSPSNEKPFADLLGEGIEALRALGVNVSPAGEAPYRMDRHKLADLIQDAGDTTAAERLRLCGEPLAGWVAQCAGNWQHVPTYIPYSCMLRVCPTCASKRSHQLAELVTPPIEALIARAPAASRLRHVILTTSISLDDATPSMIVKLRKAARRMFREHWPTDKWLGGGIGVEFGEHGRKLHFHVLLLSRFIRRDWLSSAWQDASGGAGKVVFVRAVPAAAEGVKEICKYVTKPLKAEEETQGVEQVLAKIHYAIRGIRRLQFFGSMFNLPREGGEVDKVCPQCGAPLVYYTIASWVAWRKEKERHGPHLSLIPANNSPEKPPPRCSECVSATSVRLI